MMDHRALTENMIWDFARYLRDEERAAATVEKYLRIQRRVFRDASRELTRDDYERLLEAARRQDRRKFKICGPAQP